MTLRADETVAHLQASPVVDQGSARVSANPLVFPKGVADIGDMADGAYEERGETRATTRRASTLRVAATVSADAVGLLAASVLAVWTVAQFADVPLIRQLHGAFESDTSGGVLLFALLTPYWLAALWAYGLYREPGRSIGGYNLGEGMAGLTALTSASWLLLIVLLLAFGDQAPVVPLIVFWGLASIAVPFARWVGRMTIWSRPSFQERVLIIGAGEVGHTVAAKIAGHPEYRIHVIGYLDDGEPRHNGREGPPLPVIGALRDLDAARHNDFLRIVRACADSGVKVNIVPRLFEVVSSRALVDDVEGIPLLDVANAELSRFNMAVKRVFDLVVGGLICIPALPLMGIVAVVVKLDSAGPVFFRQERMGRGGKPFEIFKFRTMHVGADGERLELAERQNDYDGPMFKLKEDPRITRIGGALRRWSIDELPQLLNVMRGDMSLVGPRPLWVEEANGRSNIPFDEMVKLDYMYVTGWSLSWDIKLLLQTVPAVLNKRGAY